MPRATARPRTRLHRASVLLLATLTAGAVCRSSARAQAGATPELSARPAAGTAGAPGDTAARVLSVEDYGRWRTIGDQAISSDGQWATWVYRHTNVAGKDEKPELHIVQLATGRDTAVADAASGEFSPDGRWLAFRVDSVPAHGSRGADSTGGSDAAPVAGGRGGARGPKVHHRMVLWELATGTTRAWHDMQSATFSRDSRFALLRDRAAPRGGRFGRFDGFGGSGRGAGEAPAGHGSDAILVDLTTGRSQLLGSVGDAAFNRPGTLLAYTVNADAKDANGLFVVDLDKGVTQALDNDALLYARLAWNEAGTGVAVLKGDDVATKLHRDNILLVFPDVRAAMARPALAPATLRTTAAGFPEGWVISDRAPLTWSGDGRLVFLGAMPQAPASDTAAVESSDSTANVDVWSTTDRYIQSMQMGRAARERNFSYREAFDVARERYVALSDSTLRDLEVSPDGRWAVGTDARAYISDWKPASADFYRVRTATGERTLMLRNQLTRDGSFGISPDGRTFLYWSEGVFNAYDLERGTSTALGAGAPGFVDTTYDHPGPKPAWGVAGYTADGRSVIVEDRYDLWTLPLDGGPARTITGGFGAKNQVVLRLVRPEPIDSLASRTLRTGNVWDLSGPLTLSAFGERTKKAGFRRLENGQVSLLVYDDATYGTPQKAAHADRYLFTRETFTESPDLRVSGRDFANAKRITDSNPQQAEYRWGHSELFTFSDRYGHELQGMLWVPDDFREGEKRPALVTFYEKNSQNLNRYPMPELLVSMGRPAIEAVSRGYVVVIPDVYYNTGSSHDDQLDCVEAATRRAIDLGYADPDHIGLHGHSYGGEGAAYIGTRSKLFAAVGEGAGVTDLYTDFSQEWGWSYQVSGGSGANGNQYYMYGQGRWGFSPWQKPDVYRDESALTHVPEVSQPILIMHGTADPTVSFNESLKFYNALRFNDKTAFLLAYQGEGHHLDKLGNRKDFTTRFFQFFDHYLEGAPAPEWMNEGVPFLKKAAVEDRGQ